MINVDLFYLTDYGEWLPLPDWCKFFMNLGSEIILRKSPKKRFVLGLIVPTRAYASSFLCAGAVISKSKELKNKQCIIGEHFKELCLLKKGTPLKYKKGCREYKAIFDGVEKIYDRLRIRVQLVNQKGGNLTELLEPEKALGVSISLTDNISLPKQQSGRPIRIYQLKKFSEHILNTTDGDLEDFISRLDCVVLGPVNVICQEVTETHLSVKLFGKSEKGTLNDIVRIRRFLKDSSVFRSDVYSMSGKKAPEIKGGIPSLIIFDGAVGYLKWRNLWRESNCVVLLDHTESGFKEAVEVLKLEFFQSRINEINLKIPNVPSGVETIAFEVYCS
jgi:hypothetical protein